MKEAILAVILPFYGYFLAYRYELGFCLVFKIPSSLISIDLISILVVISVVIIFFVLFYFFMETSIVVGGKKYILGLVIRDSSYIFMTVFVIVFLNLSFIFIILFSLPTLAMLFYDFVLPIFRHKDKSEFVIPEKNMKSYIKKSKYHQNNIAEIIEKYSFFSYIKKIGISALYFSLLILFSFLLAEPFGAFSAKTQKSYMIIKSDPELVVLRKYSENFICTTFDRKKKEIGERFVIKSTEKIADEGLEIIIEDIGPLKVAKKVLDKKAKKK